MAAGRTGEPPRHVDASRTVTGKCRTVGMRRLFLRVRGDVMGPDLIDKLPFPCTSFVGRHPEAAQVRAMFSSCRLVTLTGAGGSGKTRLGLELLTQMRRTFRDGASVVTLS